MPAVVLDDDASVNVLLPLPGAAMLVGKKLAVTPAGCPLTDSATAELNPLAAVVVTVIGIEPPGLMLTLVPPSAIVKLGATTFRLSGIVLITPPPVAITVRL